MPEPTPEEKARLVKTITDPLKPQEETDEERLHKRVAAAQQRVLTILLPVVQARGYVEEAPLHSLAAKLFLDEFCHYDKDELTYLMAVSMSWQTVELLKERKI
jgi:hypothetical protein